MGVRVIQITHNIQCFVGTGCVEPDSGLTRCGRELVAEMNRLRLVIDLSHCGPSPRRCDSLFHDAGDVHARKSKRALPFAAQQE